MDLLAYSFLLLFAVNRTVMFSTLGGAMALAGCLVLLSSASAHRQYVDHIPNGDAFVHAWKAVGHVAPLPQAISSASGMTVANVRFARNQFGRDFAAAGFTWGERLCRLDSDDDGRTNGEELGDHSCTWRHGLPQPAGTNVTHLSHPGIAGKRGEWASLLHHALALDCRVGHGCSRLGSGSGIAPGKMQVRYLAPAAEVALYHYGVVPVLLLIGYALYLRLPYVPAPRWPLVLWLSYLVCHVGVFIGCHRWAAHHAFVASVPLKWILSFFAAWCMQGTPAHWAFLHRLHHRFCDQGALDLQAPRGQQVTYQLLYGHYYWFTTPVEHFHMSSHSNSEAIIPDLMHDETLPAIGKNIGAAIGCHIATVAVIALGYAGCEFRRKWLDDAVPCRAWGETAVKAYVVACWYFWLPCAIAFQCVLLVIDAVHLWGDLAFEDAMSAPCQARNNAFLLLPLLGENWHNNHHSTPHSASNWAWWYQIDCQYLLIRLFEALGLASDVVVGAPSKLREGYVANGAHVALEWLALAAVVSTPWWSGKLMGRLSTPGRAPLSRRDGLYCESEHDERAVALVKSAC